MIVSQQNYKPIKFVGVYAVGAQGKSLVALENFFGGAPFPKLTIGRFVCGSPHTKLIKIEELPQGTINIPNGGMEYGERVKQISEYNQLVWEYTRYAKAKISLVDGIISPKTLRFQTWEEAKAFKEKFEWAELVHNKPDVVDDQKSWDYWHEEEENWEHEIIPVITKGPTLSGGLVPVWRTQATGISQSFPTDPELAVRQLEGEYEAEHIRKWVAICNIINGKPVN